MLSSIARRQARTNTRAVPGAKKRFRFATAAGLAAAAVATTVLTGAPAGAQEAGTQKTGAAAVSWELWNSVIGPEDDCTPTNEPLTGVFVQTCALRDSSKRYGQGALIVINHRSSAVEIVGSVRLTNYNSSSACKRSPLSVGIRVVCFSPTVPISGPIGAASTFEVRTL
ncbi:hypothetical protein ACWDR0_32920 [Streptomyces sp. NPDC003691]